MRLSRNSKWQDAVICNRCTTINFSGTHCTSCYYGLTANARMW